MDDQQQGVAKDDASKEATVTSKGERTRQLILQTALDMFLDQGYDKTTMRAIAKRAGVSVGNAYYYFGSKEHLIQGFYGHTHRQLVEASAPLLAEEDNFKERLHGVIRTHIENVQQYQDFAGVLFRTAADPKSPLNPFSEASKPVRRESTELFAQVVEGSSTRFPEPLRQELPDLLWLYHMGIVLYWIFDRSPDSRRTHRLLDATVDLVVKLVMISRLPPLRPLVRSALSLLAELRDEDETPDATAQEATTQETS